MPFHDVPIFVYHKLSKEKEKNRYTITSDHFVDHLKYLSNHDYKTILVDELLVSLGGGSIQLPEKTVVLTFDDGHSSDYSIALPALKQYGFVATFFITTDWIGKEGYMEDEQLKLLEENGMSIQLHGKTHRFFDDMEVDQLFDEVILSAKRLRMVVPRVAFMSFPGGRYTKIVYEFAGKAGIKAVFSSDPYLYRKEGSVWLVGRHVLKYSGPKITLSSLLRASYVYKVKIVASAWGKKKLKLILGNKLYYFLWRHFITR